MHEKSFSETERLYYIDSEQWEFDAEVVSFEKCEDETYALVLDKTAFFPEGGGQDGDVGTIGDFPVIDTKEKDGLIIHILGAKADVPEVANADGSVAGGEEALGQESAEISYIQPSFSQGELVHGVVDKEIRFDRMQQHTGEHIICGIIHSKYDCNNVGFHLSDEKTTFDFDAQLSEEQLLEVEREANKAVFANIPIETLFPTKEEEKTIDYRSKLDIEGQVRLVSIPGVDMCACCAPHVKTTGEVGLIKIVEAINYKGGMRLTIACGGRALSDYVAKEHITKTLQQEFSAPQEEILSAVSRAKEESEERRKTILNWQERYASVAKAETYATRYGEALVLALPELDMDIARRYVNEHVASADLTIALIGDDDAGYKFIIGSEKVNLRDASKELNEALNGRGGGKPEMIQGTFMTKLSEIKAFLNN